MARPRVLFIAHSHSSTRPGGVERYLDELMAGFRAGRAFEPWLLARGQGPSGSWPHPGTPFSAIPGVPEGTFLNTRDADYDLVNGTQRDKELLTRHLATYLATVRPAVVHVQHSLHLGYDLLRVIRRVLPQAPIVYTLHELLPICHRDGQMVRAGGDELCGEASPQSCHACFPGITPRRFLLRKRFIQAQLQLVDLFLSPSRFLIDRYAAWGIEADRIRFEPNGRRLGTVAPCPRRPRVNLAYFGQFTPYKGLPVLLEAMRLLRERGRHEVCLRIHGGGLAELPAELRARVEAIGLNDQVTWLGGYRTEEVGPLMQACDWVVLPSIWWENSPLVIQEAFFHRRPVICSGIGGMAEKVRDGVDGLHFRVGDPSSLAEQLDRATSDDALWTWLRSQIQPVHPMRTHVQTLQGMYRELLEQRVERGWIQAS